MRDLSGASAADVAAVRARVQTEGWGAQLLAMQATDGRWGNVTWNRGWNSTMHVLLLLRELGLDPDSAQAQTAISRVRKHVTWKGCGPPECDGNHFFEGELEPCINAQVATISAYFHQDPTDLVERLLSEQLPDGGWNCEASSHSSFNTTACVLEALHETERSGTTVAGVNEARQRGEAYLVNRRLRHRLSTGEAIHRDRKSGGQWTQFSYPNWWRYDVLRGLDYLRRADFPADDDRLESAFAIVRDKQRSDGTWNNDAIHPGTLPIDLHERVRQPSRWITLRALRVLRWQTAHLSASA